MTKEEKRQRLCYALNSALTEEQRADARQRYGGGGPTVAEPDRPCCEPDGSCCDFCCGN